jgi:hypothetical protein
MLFSTPGGCADVIGMYRNKFIGFWEVRVVRHRLSGSMEISKSKKTTELESFHLSQ